MVFISKLKQLRHKLYIFYYSKLPIKNNKIIMWANSFKQYGCSPKYITEYLLKYFPDKYDIVWVFDQSVEIPDNLSEKVRKVRYFSIDYLKELHTAKFIICNMRTSDAYYWNKRRNQIYIQTWHSSIRLKKIERDANNLDEKYIDIAKKDSKRIDLILSGCEFSTKIFKNSFWYNGKILKSGTPRCDILINNSNGIKDKVYKYFNIDKGSKILLYAPTFRDSKTADIHGFDFESIKKVVENRFGGKWTIMYRFHPNILSSCEDKQSGNYINATKYSDMQELIVASDILVTDYSSCMFDMAIAKKKCFLYAPDLDEYNRTERGLYFKIEQLPFPIAESNEEMIDIISNFNENEYMTRIRQFMKCVGSYEDGHAAERVAKYIEEIENV